MNRLPFWLARVLFTFAIVLFTHLAPAQEKSVRPGINKDFENPDVKDFIGKFEVETVRRALAALHEQVARGHEEGRGVTAGQSSAPPCPSSNPTK